MPKKLRPKSRRQRRGPLPPPRCPPGGLSLPLRTVQTPSGRAAIVVAAATTATTATKILCAGLPTSRKQLTLGLLSSGSTRTARNFGLVLCLGLLHLFMSRKANLSPHRSFPCHCQRGGPTPDSPTTPTYQPTAYFW